jgi:hypothetical protein
MELFPRVDRVGCGTIGPRLLDESWRGVGSGPYSTLPQKPVKGRADDSDAKFQRNDVGRIIDVFLFGAQSAK